MSLRTKISYMLSAFVVLIVVFASGTLFIFDNLRVNMESLHSFSTEHKLVGDIQDTFSDFLTLTNNWALTGDAIFRRQYQKKLMEANKSFEEIRGVSLYRREFDAIEKDFGRLADLAKAVMASRYPVGDPEVAARIQEINNIGKEIAARFEQMHNHSMGRVIDVALKGEKLERDMIYYLLALILFSLFAAFFLIFRIRRIISEPFMELLKATERISRGELSYRIQMDRTDEFGIVANRFNSMVAELEASNEKVNRKLSDTELFLDVTRIAGTTLDLKDALFWIAETITFKLNNDNCAIYLVRPELKAFCLDASNRTGEVIEDICLPADDGIAREVTTTLQPVVVPDTEQYSGADLKLKDRYRSLICLPILRDNLCHGILLIRNKSFRLFSEDEVNTLTIIAQTIGSVARNAELYQSTKKQLQKLTVLYELSRAVTSLLDLEELLMKTAEEISRLLSARGCIIRLLENDILKIKSYFRLPAGIDDVADLPIGSGIAGWVAEHGSSLLVEDVTKMPAGVNVTMKDVKSVLCVPLKVGDAVIGTLGLYDKYNAEGSLIPFSSDDLNTAEGFASISAIAIEKSRIYENEVRREKEASDAKKRLDILFDSVQGGIITLDKDFTIISANRYIEDWIGISADQLIGRSSLDVFHDKIGICPHCASKATFETGEINSIMQSRGVNYAELTSYPVRDESGEIKECAVFIMDITERVLYQEETLSLYREVIQTKEYLESIIDNSADAIVTSDPAGLITSWNQGAEKIFGFTEAEAMGKFLPFAPEFLLDREKENIEKIKKGEVMKDIETLRRKKDGTIIEVSLTLSPIKDAAGDVIGISGISRDISEKKSVEKELIRRNQELSRLFFISSAMRGTLELDKLLRMVLIAVTMSDGMGFNRAILFLVDEEKQLLKGAMGVGPASPEEAWRVWDELSLQKKTLDDIMQEVISRPLAKDSFLDKLTVGIEISIGEETVLTNAVKEKRSFNIVNVQEEPLSHTILIQQLGTQAYAIVPLISRDKVIGLIWVDNYFNRKQITDEDMKFLTSFSNNVASAIENARLFEQVKMAEQQLENIFESMSDMVYFNSNDYVIKSINKAVSNRLGLPASEIIGKKCYEVFHGTNEP
ncbi:MAG: PAS domain S-box protein, partial [Nitrospirae bacterium]|nr:PAS domain S-box protein [Nitrospirota bacterium]